MTDETGDRTLSRSLQNVVTIDFHRGRRDRSKPYWECMGEVWTEAEAAIRQAYEEGRSWLIIGHGQSTSRPFHVTARSNIRRLVRDKSMTPYILREQSVRHDTFFEVKIRPKPSASPTAGEGGSVVVNKSKRPKGRSKGAAGSETQGADEKP